MSEDDVKQLTVLINLLQHAKHELKGDALPVAAQAVTWAHDLSKRLKTAEEFPEDKRGRGKIG